MRQALMAIEEIMGEPGLKAVLRASGLEKYIDNTPLDDLEPAISFDDYAKLKQAGVALKLMPKHQRIKFVLNSLGNALKKASPDTEFWVDDRDNKITNCIRDCSICAGRSDDKPVGHRLIG